ncbi:MAG: acetoacetate--CoA ligase, partial [Candidatus Margulisiibacteriota bacterium]
LEENQPLTPELKKDIRNLLKEKASPRHMPQMIFQVNEIPYTINGKKCEVSVKKILWGDDLIVQKSTLQNENSFDEYLTFAQQLRTN